MNDETQVLEPSIDEEIESVEEAEEEDIYTRHAKTLRHSVKLHWPAYEKPIEYYLNLQYQTIPVGFVNGASNEYAQYGLLQIDDKLEVMYIQLNNSRSFVIPMSYITSIGFESVSGIAMLRTRNDAFFERNNYSLIYDREIETMSFREQFARAIFNNQKPPKDGSNTYTALKISVDYGTFKEDVYLVEVGPLLDYESGFVEKHMKKSNFIETFFWGFVGKSDVEMLYFNNILKHTFPTIIEKVKKVNGVTQKSGVADRLPRRWWYFGDEIMFPYKATEAQKKRAEELDIFKEEMKGWVTAHWNHIDHKDKLYMFGSLIKQVASESLPEAMRTPENLRKALGFDDPKISNTKIKGDTYKRFYDMTGKRPTAKTLGDLARYAETCHRISFHGHELLPEIKEWYMEEEIYLFYDGKEGYYVPTREDLGLEE